MKKWSFITLLAVLVLALAACGTSSKEKTGAEGKKTITVENNFGVESKDGEKSTVKETVKVPVEPKKVVVLDLGFLDTLNELGVKDDVVGVPTKNIPEYLNEFKDEKYNNVGGVKEPDLEKIASLKPEAIFISARQAPLFDELNKIAPTVYVGIEDSRYMDSFKEDVQLAGKIFGKEKEADDALKNVQTKIDALHEKVTKHNAKALIALGSQGSLSVYGAGSRFGLIHDVFGFKQADDKIEVSKHGQTVTSEYIYEKDPEILFVIDRDSAIGEKSTVKNDLENELIKKTKAYKNGKIIYLNAGTWYLSGGGLESMSLMIDDAEKALK